MYIFIDDERLPKDVTWSELPNPETWNVCRSYNGFVKLLESLEEPPSYISFDHDLGAEHYKHVLHDDSEGEIPYDSFAEKTGYDCAMALLHICAERDWKVPAYNCHSMNPVGKKNILFALNFADKQIALIKEMKNADGA